MFIKKEMNYALIIRKVVTETLKPRDWESNFSFIFAKTLINSLSYIYA